MLEWIYYMGLEMLVDYFLGIFRRYFFYQRNEEYFSEWVIRNIEKFSGSCFLQVVVKQSMSGFELCKE